MASAISPAAGYLLALTVADVVYSTTQGAMLIIHNIPVWKGFPLDIVMSDIFMIFLDVIVQWPVILFLSFLPFLAALLLQKAIRAHSDMFYIGMGMMIAALSTAAAYLFIFRALAEDPTEHDPFYFAAHTGLIAMFAGAVGGLFYRSKTLRFPDPGVK